MTQKIAYFRFEASPNVGAGHAMRSTVIADALTEKGWDCQIVTLQESYDFIKNLDRFKRIAPDDFYNNPPECDLLVVDNYDLNHRYESHFRTSAKKIMVIDDLADRQHDCDILLDQTYGRDAEDYKKLVPANCEILAGSDYVLLRKEFINLRPKALEKRKNTKEIKRILVSLGGSDPKNFTLNALQMIKESDFKGVIDIVLGFSAPNIESVKKYADSMGNDYTIYTNADMPTLIYDANLAIGAAGSSVWERCCLGLPQVLMVTADNQQLIYENFKNNSINKRYEHLLEKSLSESVDSFGVNRILTAIHSSAKGMDFRKIKISDKSTIFKWQSIKEIRRFFNNPNPPIWEEHNVWFEKRIIESNSPYWIIDYEGVDVGILSLSYNTTNEAYDLSWFILPEYSNKGLGTKALCSAKSIVHPLKIHAYVKENNIASRKSLIKAGFTPLDSGNFTSGGV